uniref:Uncharacterized protein n=1 Tax=Trichogramma kaykai TaxID=54128 RepID=A0ABD2VW22_9HYME
MCFTHGAAYAALSRCVYIFYKHTYYILYTYTRIRYCLPLGRFRAREDIYLPDRCCCISGFFERNKLYLTCERWNMIKVKSSSSMILMEYCTRTRSGYIIVIEICGALATPHPNFASARAERSLSDLLYTASAYLAWLVAAAAVE